MTFIEIQTLLNWARDNRVAQLKLTATSMRDESPALEVAFYPDRIAVSSPAIASPPPTDWRSRVDQEAFGMSLEDKA